MFLVADNNTGYEANKGENEVVNDDKALHFVFIASVKILPA
jgi:hypothetical protein